MSEKIVIQDILEPVMVDTEDGGQAKIARGLILFPYDDDGEFFVRIHSFYKNKKHTLFDSLIGKEIRITIEVIE